VTTVSYLAQALAYSVVGFAAGYGAAWVTRRAAEDDAKTAGRRVEWWRVPLGLLLLSLVAYTVISTTRFNACQHETNSQFVAALAQRGAAQKDWITAQEAFLDATAAPGATPTSRLAAYRQYRDALTRLKAVQDANPLQVRDCP
jgi:hypothetical protein